MTMTNEWMEVCAESTMGAVDDRVFARKSPDYEDAVDVAYAAYDGVKIVTISGIKTMSEDADFEDALEELADCFDVAIAVDGGTVLAIDSCDAIANDVDGYDVVSTQEFSSDELAEEHSELADLYGMV